MRRAGDVGGATRQKVTHWLVGTALHPRDSPQRWCRRVWDRQRVRIVARVLHAGMRGVGRTHCKAAHRHRLAALHDRRYSATLGDGMMANKPRLTTRGSFASSSWGLFVPRGAKRRAFERRRHYTARRTPG